MTAELDGPDPMILRRRLRKELRDARERGRRRQKDVADKMDWSVSKLIRIETGTVNISTNDLKALLEYYDTAPTRIDELIQTARAARAATPWSAWKNQASAEYLTLLGYETAAVRIRNFEPFVVPGLLQTEAYAREVLRSLDAPDEEWSDSLVDLRMKRQELVSRPSPPDLHFIMDESAIHRQVGSPELMRRQLEQILTLSMQEHVTVRVVEFKQGMYRQMRIPYVLLEFASDEDEDVLYVENPLDELIKESSSAIGDVQTPSNYLNHFWGLEQIASKEATSALLEAALESFS